MYRTLHISILVAALVGLAGATLAGQQVGTDSRAADRERLTVWDGVYTESQATEGRSLYNSRCSECHGEGLGGAIAQALRGTNFMERWREDTVDSLFAVVQNMPPGQRLSDHEYMRIISYILEANGFPAGGSELTTTELASVWIEGRDGPQPLPDRAVVQVVGCLTKEGPGWNLTEATPPVRTRHPDEASEIELKAAQSKNLGERTFGLQNFFMLGLFDLDSHSGHKMLAKGALLRRDDGDRISLTALDMVAEECGR